MRLTPGKILYDWYFAPLRTIRWACKVGPLAAWKSRAGARALEVETQRFLADSRIRLENRGQIPRVSVVYVGGRKLMPLMVTGLISLYRHVGAARVLVVSDGTLDADTARLLMERFEGLECVLDISPELERTLPRSEFPGLRRLRDEFILARKLVDVHLANPGWSLVVDADTCFLKTPVELLDWAADPQRPIFIHNGYDVYGYPVDEMWALAGARPVAPVNSGLVGIRSDTIDWKLLESWYAELSAKHARTHFTEQDLYAMLLSRMGSGVLSREDYIVMPTARDVRRRQGVFHHYVGPCRHLFYGDVWREFLPYAPVVRAAFRETAQS